MQTWFRRATLCLLYLMSVAFTSSLFGQAPEVGILDAGSVVNQGVQALRSGNAQSAAEAFSRALQLDPASTTAQMYLANAYASQFMQGSATPQNQELGTKAIAAFEAYLTRTPGSAEGLNGLGQMYQAMADFVKAREVFKRLTETSSGSAAAFAALGGADWLVLTDKNHPVPVAARTDLVTEGLSSVDRALALDPQFESAAVYKNLLLREKAGLTKDPVEAARLLTEADLWFNRARSAVASLPRTTTSTPRVPPAPPQPGAPRAVSAPRVAAAPPSPAQPAQPLKPQSASGTPVRVSGDVARANLSHQIQPQYPEAAKQARVTGAVLLQARIDTSGAVKDLQVVSGHPLLVDSALEAVGQWRYKPFLLNGQAADVITTITVNYSLQ